jgi:hypothetical protein
VRVSFQLLDQIVVVESESPAFITDLRSCFEDDVSRPHGGAGPADLYVRVRVTPATGNGAKQGCEVTSIPHDALRIKAVRLQGAGWTVGRALVQWAVDSTSNHYVFHSGSVARDGRGILLPGSTHSGKSTLTVALAQRGFDILSDEVGAIRMNDGLQTSFGRALSIRSAVVSELGIEHRLGSGISAEGGYVLRASVLGLSRASIARPFLVVSPEYQETASADLRPVRPAAAVMALYEASCSQQRWKGAGLDFVIDLATRIPCFELAYSNMHDAARLIENKFAELCAAEAVSERSREWTAEREESPR